MNDFVDFDCSDFAGILAIGDIHGMSQQFDRALSKAENENLYVVSLGDIVDYGEDSVGCVNRMARLIAENKGIMVQGNHERKLSRYFQGLRDGEIKIKIKGGLLKSIEQFDKLAHEELDSFMQIYDWVIDRSPLIARNQNLLFVHGAIEPAFWVSTEFKGTINGKIRDAAYFGQVTRGEFTPDGYPKRRYEWVNKIKPNRIVIVGHDVQSQEEPKVIKNGRDGSVIFTDAGCGKGGRLLTCTLKDDNGKFKPVEFTYF